MLPRVILHNGASVDGRMDWDWATMDVGLYYELAARFQADAMLSGSNTILAAPSTGEATEENDDTVDLVEKDPNDPRPWLVVVDSQGRLQNLHRLRREPYWRDVLALCSHTTPHEHLAYLHKHHLEYIVAGDGQVDLRGALEELNTRYGVKVVRVDSGGILNGVLLRAGLVDEISILVTPCLVGGTTPRSFFVAPNLVSAEGVVHLRLLYAENVKDDTVWLRYEVVRTK